MRLIFSMRLILITPVRVAKIKNTWPYWVVMIKWLTCSYTAYENGKCYNYYQIKSLVASSKVKCTSTITFLDMYPSQVKTYIRS